MFCSVPQVPFSYHPATFMERGVAVPFTAIGLAGARARPSQRDGFELVIPNLSGCRGAYVLPWTGVAGTCQPTVHDVQLLHAIAALGTITPQTIRVVARQVASEGFAGRDARAAAAAALVLEERATVVTNFELLLRVVGQTEPHENWPADKAGSLPFRSPADLEHRSKRAIAVLSLQLGQGSEAMTAALASIAGLLTPIGLGRWAEAGRIPRSIARLEAFRSEVAAFAQDTTAGAHATDIALTLAELTLANSNKAVVDARFATNDMPGLLRDWFRDARFVYASARADWLLDGWDRICLIWDTATHSPADRSLALDEIATLLPAIPLEVGNWTGYTTGSSAAAVINRSVGGREDWRTGQFVTDIVARNERLCAASL